MRRFTSARLRGLLFVGLMGLSAPLLAANGDPAAAVETIMERIEGLARDFGEACDRREKTRRVSTDAPSAAAIHDRMVAEVERLRAAALRADHRTARRILNRFNDVAFSFARNYLGPGEGVIEAVERPAARAALKRYRAAVSRMKGNLFGWNPDLDALRADLGVVTETVEEWVDGHSPTGVPVAGL